jgi:hypothetical protein
MFQTQYKTVSRNFRTRPRIPSQIPRIPCGGRSFLTLVLPLLSRLTPWNPPPLALFEVRRHLLYRRLKDRHIVWDRIKRVSVNIQIMCKNVFIWSTKRQGKRFFYPPHSPDRLWGPLNLLNNGYAGDPRGKMVEAWSWPLTSTQCRCWRRRSISPFPHTPLYRIYLSRGSITGRGMGYLFFLYCRASRPGLRLTQPHI